jgi:hypothetical protein
VKFTDAWAFSDEVQPLFLVPSCVLFARSGDGGGSRLPSSIRFVAGQLPRRDASGSEAATHLSWRDGSWPTERVERVTEGYADRFRQGAIIIPRVLFTVQKVEAGILGSNLTTPLVESRRTSLEKPPWKDIAPVKGNVETGFLYPLYLGECIAPFRVLAPILSVLPWDRNRGQLVDAAEAQSQGYAHLAGWMRKAEQAWSQHGSARRTLLEQLDYYGQLSAQFPLAALRVVYSKAGTLPAAALLRDQNSVVDHKLYWAPTGSVAEAHYLLAILNSETAREKAEHLQSRGQWGARDFDKVILSLSIPQFDPANKLHQTLARAAVRAEKVAATVELGEGMHFVKARQQIRAALGKDGVAQKIDKAVGELLNLPASR